jgi:hypothetical protein
MTPTFLPPTEPWLHDLPWWDLTDVSRVARLKLAARFRVRPDPAQCRIVERRIVRHEQRSISANPHVRNVSSTAAQWLDATDIGWFPTGVTVA